MTGPVDPAFLAELRRRVGLAELIMPAVEQWRPVRAGEYRALCPFHTERTPSFYVVEDKGFWHCFGCGAHGDAVGWVRRMTDARDFREAVEYLAARVGLAQSGPPLAAKAPQKQPMTELRDKDREKRVAGARAIWAQGQVATEWTAAGRYLREARRIRLAPPPTLRFHPALAHPHWRRDARFPALIAAMQDKDRKIVGCRAIYLTQAGTKLPAPPGWPADEPWKSKIMRGQERGAAHRLTPLEDVVVLAEGIETALSVMQALWDRDLDAPALDDMPVAVWAAGSLGNMGRVELPAGVREIVLAADADGKRPPVAEPGDRRHWADPDELILAAAARHRAEGRNVRIARPPAGTDFNDLVPPGGGAGEFAENAA